MMMDARVSISVIICVMLAIIIFIVTIPKDKKDYGQCLESHRTIGWYQPMLIGKVMTMIYHPPMTVCDKWEFPEGRLVNESSN